MKRSLIALAALFTFFACQKEIPLKQEEIDPRIVVNSIFTANDTIRVSLSESRNVLYEGALPVITNATVKLLDENDNEIADFVHEGGGVYASTDVLPTSGSVYGLKVGAAGLNSVKAQSETPSIITSATIDTTSVGIPGDEMEFKITFTDDVAQKNYYGVTIIHVFSYDDGMGGEMTYEDPYFSTQEIYVTNSQADPDGKKYASGFYFSDESFNGQTISFTGLSYFSEFEEGSYYVVGIESLSEDLFKYKLSYAKYLEVQGSPFAEPVQVYSNIEDGFGIFGGSSVVRDTIFTE